MKTECPRCGEIELALEPSTKEMYIREYYCQCGHMECRENLDYDPTPDEQGEPPVTWLERSKMEKPR